MADLNYFTLSLMSNFLGKSSAFLIYICVKDYEYQILWHLDTSII